MNTPHTPYLVTSVGSAGSALTWIYTQALEHGPSWSLAPPILLAGAALTGAFWSGTKVRQEVLAARTKLAQDLRQSEAKLAQELRQNEEVHWARLTRIRAGLTADPGPAPGADPSPYLNPAAPPPPIAVTIANPEPVAVVLAGPAA